MSKVDEVMRELDELDVPDCYNSEGEHFLLSVANELRLLRYALLKSTFESEQKIEIKEVE